MTRAEMVERFQCPGCVAGSDTQCGSFRPSGENGGCLAHVLGTFSPGSGSFALGLPKGFNRAGWEYQPADVNRPIEHRNQLCIRLWPEGGAPLWDKFNVPVWAMEWEGVLLVRTFSPRVNFSCVDVVENGTLKMVPQALNAAEFLEEMD